MKNRDECDFWGYNSRLDNIQAGNIEVIDLDEDGACDIVDECVGELNDCGDCVDLAGTYVMGTCNGECVEGDDDGKFFSLSVGSGLTDEEREKFWASKDKLIGRLVEIRADAITQSIEGEHFSLRFPRFKNFRGFKKDEKI